MDANSLMGLHADVQTAVRGLTVMVRSLRDHSLDARDVDLGIVEEGLKEVGDAMLVMSADLRNYATGLEDTRKATLELFDSAKTILLHTKALAERAEAATATPTPVSQQVYIPEEFRPQGHLRDMVRPNSTVVPFTGVTRQRDREDGQ